MANWYEEWSRGKLPHFLRYPTLEKSIFSGSFRSYFTYRLQNFSINTIAQALLHVAELWFLLRYLQEMELYTLIYFRIVFFLFSSFWWGFLEPLREKIRFLKSNKLIFRAPRTIVSYYNLGFLVSSVFHLLCLALGLLLVETLALKSLLFVYCLRSFVGVNLRTLHSGAYGIRRVYRTLESFLWPNVAASALTITGVLFLSLPGFVLAEILSGVLFLGFNWFFLSRAFSDLSIPFPRLIPRWRVLYRMAQRSGAFVNNSRHWMAGLSYLFYRVELWAIVLIFSPTVALVLGETTNYFLLFYLLLPLTRAGGDWATLFYFDLKKLSKPFFASIYLNYSRKVLLISLMYPLLLASGAIVLLRLFYGFHDWVLYPVLVLFFFTKSVFSFSSILMFCQGRYRTLVFSGLSVVLLFYVLRISYITSETKIAVVGGAFVLFSCLFYFLRGLGRSTPKLSKSRFEFLREARTESLRTFTALAEIHLIPQQTFAGTRWLQREVMRKLRKELCDHSPIISASARGRIFLLARKKPIRREDIVVHVVPHLRRLRFQPVSAPAADALDDLDRRVFEKGFSIGSESRERKIASLEALLGHTNVVYVLEIDGFRVLKNRHSIEGFRILMGLDEALEVFRAVRLTERYYLSFVLEGEVLSHVYLVSKEGVSFEELQELLLFGPSRAIQASFGPSQKEVMSQ